MVLSNSEFYSSIIVKNAIDCLAARKKEAMRKLILVAAEIKSETLDDELVRALSELRRFGKGMKTIRSMLIKGDDRALSQIYFTKIKSRAEELRNQNKEPSFFARLFSRSH